ncbi:S8 family peptidase [Bradyrhizobium japonicum]|uniref:S8 family peptidase n=1 Tax=Bradyrhizobium japonicum TaxID=375 RepID=UPI0004AE8342|nr:S8 family peptidase [Bradyrhizobium japonicum]
MVDKRNFFLGKGERLTEPVTPSGRVVEKEPPYTYEEARIRLAPMLDHTMRAFADLPEMAKPKGEVVGGIVLNPEYIAKSYYPERVFKFYGLRSVGSKPTLVTPEKRSKQRPPEEKPTTKLYVAGAMSNFRRLLADIEQGAIVEAVQGDLTALEQVEPVDARSKLKGRFSDVEISPLEVVLHASEFRSDLYIIESFRDYVANFGLQADLDHRFHAGGLCFIRMRAPREQLAEIAQFSYLRALREMPRLRDFFPLRSLKPSKASFVILPGETVVDPNVRVAIFDGGIPEGTLLDPWVTRFEPPGIGPPVPEALEHGYAVTSAVLFGSHKPGEAAVPFTNVDHIRVWDQDSGADPLELYDVLERIKNTLDTSPKYDFINLSLGPSLTVEDDDVHAWTAVLDEYLADGTCLATVAVGNDGEADAAQGLNRVQVPSDTVNGLAVGATDCEEPVWKRASYSSIGPGRSPGVVKPDLVAFGGCEDMPYMVLSPNAGTALVPQCGTSFASPHALRIGAGVKANFGGSLEALAVKALLIHTADEGEEPQSHIGWGRVRDNIDDIAICPDGSVRVVYQGELTASKYLRAAIPLPDENLKGKVRIKATLCYSTEIDSAHPGTYTRSGLEVFFRPHAGRFEPKAVHPKTEPFFSQSKLYDLTEETMRRDAHKWETCLHGFVSKLGKSYEEPVFDIHYVARDEGHVERQSPKIKYALVITIEAPRHADLYDLIVRKYRNILEPMLPIQVPIQVQ